MIGIPAEIGSSVALGGGAGGAFFILKWFTEWLSGRLDKREARIDQIQDDLLRGLLKDVERLKSEGETMRGQIVALQDELIICKTEHAEARGQIVELKALLDAGGIARQQAAVIVAANRESDRANRD